jgi:methylglutaconyl-CoA hydratase
MSAGQYITREDDDRGVVRITLDRDNVRNAMNRAMVEQLRDAFTDVSTDTDVRVVVLSGRGRAFSAGADIDHMEKLAASSYEGNLEDSYANDELFRTIDGCPHPVISRVNGHAIGGGAALIACSDIAVAARDAKIGFGEVRIGISPAVISTFVVPKIGLSAARRLLVTGMLLSAESAQSIGLVHEVADAAELDTVTESVIDEVLGAWPEAQRATKKLLSTWPTSGREGYRALAIETASRVRASEEGKRGMSAFLEQARERSSRKGER